MGFVWGPDERGNALRVDGWVLVDTSTGSPLRLGDVRVDFRGERLTVVGGQPPHKIASTGRVTVLPADSDMPATYYPGVIGAEWTHQYTPIKVANRVRCAVCHEPLTYCRGKGANR